MLYVDNYLEGFHIPYVHPELNQALDHAGYETETFEGGVLQIGKAVDGDRCLTFHPAIRTRAKPSLRTTSGCSPT